MQHYTMIKKLSQSQSVAVAESQEVSLKMKWKQVFHRHMYAHCESRVAKHQCGTFLKYTR